MRFSHLEIITYCLIIIVCACHFCVPAMVLDLLIESSQSLVLVHDAEHIARLYSIRQPLNISLAPCQLFNVPVLIYLFPFGQIHSLTPWHICLHLLSPGLKCPCVRKGGQVPLLLRCHFRVSDCRGWGAEQAMGWFCEVGAAWKI